MGKTSIEWTDVSWPVLNGCRRISPGCQNCYAEQLTATRLRNTPKYKGLALYTKGGPRWTGKTRLWERDLTMPLRLRKPSMIFVCDMGDLFYEGNENEEIAAIFGVMAACPRHTFQVLTKRPDRMRRWFNWVFHDCGFEGMQAGKLHMALCDAMQGPKEWDPEGLVCEELLSNASEWPLSNVWCGVSAEDQQRADERIPDLLATPAAVRFVSAEPLLGPIDLAMATRSVIGGLASDGLCIKHLDWVIVGGESGRKARPYDLEWASSLISQCKNAGVPIFHKQVGAHPVTRWSNGDLTERLRLKHPKGADPSEWPAALRVREFPP
jgi:protein gp37